VIKGVEDADAGFASLKEAIAKSFKDHQGVTIFASLGGDIGVNYAYLDRDKETREYLDPDAEAQNFIDKIPPNVKETMTEIMAKGCLSVVPTRNVMLGMDTSLNAEGEIKTAAEEKRRPNITTVDPQTFQNLSLSTRFAMTMNMAERMKIPQEKLDMVLKALSESGSDATKTALARKNFNGVAEEDIKSVFKEAGIEFANHLPRGYAVASHVLKAHETGEGGYVTKSFVTQPASPYPPNVEAVKEARANYYVEIADAIKAFESPEKKVEAPVAGAEAEKAPAADPAPATAPEVESTAPAQEAVADLEETDIDEADIDDLLADHVMDDPDADMKI
jgi:hypothetical protein